jgi:hypothetical protein
MRYFDEFLALGKDVSPAELARVHTRLFEAANAYMARTGSCAGWALRSVLERGLQTLVLGPPLDAGSGRGKKRGALSSGREEMAKMQRRVTDLLKTVKKLPRPRLRRNVGDAMKNQDLIAGKPFNPARSLAREVEP